MVEQVINGYSERANLGNREECLWSQLSDQITKDLSVTVHVVFALLVITHVAVDGSVKKGEKVGDCRKASGFDVGCRSTFFREPRTPNWDLTYWQ